MNKDRFLLGGGNYLTATLLEIETHNIHARRHSYSGTFRFCCCFLFCSVFICTRRAISENAAYLNLTYEYWLMVLLPILWKRNPDEMWATISKRKDTHSIRDVKEMSKQNKMQHLMNPIENNTFHSTLKWFSSNPLLFIRDIHTDWLVKHIWMDLFVHCSTFASTPLSDIGGVANLFVARPFSTHTNECSLTLAHIITCISPTHFKSTRS